MSSETGNIDLLDGLIRKPILTIPNNVEIIDSKTSYSWFGEDGILYSISKHVDSLPREESLEEIEDFLNTYGRKKYCFVIDISNAKPSGREEREFASEIFPDLCHAMALVANSALGNMMANLYLGLRPPTFPTKLFKNPEVAAEWIKQYSHL